MRGIARKGFIQHGAERIDVGAAVDLTIAGGLFGRHVLRGAEREAGLRDPRAAGVADGECDPEVGDEGLAFVEENVLGLEVAVDHAVPVRVVERAGNRGRDVECFVDG